LLWILNHIKVFSIKILKLITTTNLHNIIQWHLRVLWHLRGFSETWVAFETITVFFIIVVMLGLVEEVVVVRPKFFPLVVVG